MPGERRSLPARPSLRYLKLEAKRRLSAGEFTALYEAQLAIAREHGLPSWAALKRLICGRPVCHVIPQLSWVISRFAGVDGPQWSPPDDHELRQHFADRVLSRTPPDKLVAQVVEMTVDLREELVVTAEAPLAAQVRIAGFEIFATVAAKPPHQLTGVRRLSLGARICDSRTTAPATRIHGQVPAAVAGITQRAFADLGLVGLVVAGGGTGTPAWGAASGWADLEQGEPIDTSHRFPAAGITPLVTATTVLRLVADGRVRLDGPANHHLRTVRLADGSVTVRELLTHTGGVDHPVEPFAGHVPGLAALTGPVIKCNGERGIFRLSHEGYGVLGQLVADVTGWPYPVAATRLVLDPLGMRSSSFPARWPDTGGAIVGYDVAPAGTFEPEPPRIYTMPAAGCRGPVGDGRGPGAFRSLLVIPAPAGAGQRGAPAPGTCHGVRPFPARPRLAHLLPRQRYRGRRRPPWRLGVLARQRGWPAGARRPRQPLGPPRHRYRPAPARRPASSGVEVQPTTRSANSPYSLAT
jgi:CubicO group peptidase (beta-lactamase class C family)